MSKATYQHTDLNNIRIVLVRTFHSGNIGSAARAMKTMGLNNLYLVNPVDFESEVGKNAALKMARTAEDVVHKAIISETLYDAVKDCNLVIASSARSRAFDSPNLSPEESALKICTSSKKNKVALVFGPERMGLTNDDLQYMNYRVTIPTSPEYSSLNLAAAVQTLSYEVFKHSEQSNADGLITREFPDTKKLDYFYQTLESTLQQSEFIFKKHPGEIIRKLRVLFTRAEPDTTELSILQGMLASFSRKMSHDLDISAATSKTSRKRGGVPILPSKEEGS